MRTHLFVALASLSVAAAPPVWKLDSPQGLEMLRGSVEAASYRGRRALHLMPAPGTGLSEGDMLAVLSGTDFKDGTIELDLAGAPRRGTDPTSRGFVGVAFRVQREPEGLELFYLRPTNGRATDQLQRNHSTQYVSSPDWPWQRLRQEAPGQFESYVDLEAGAWTHVKIEVEGTRARLYVNGASQPALVVTELKRGQSHGAVALWAHASTEAWFSNLRLRQPDEASR